MEEEKNIGRMHMLLGNPSDNKYLERWTNEVTLAWMEHCIQITLPVTSSSMWYNNFPPFLLVHPAWNRPCSGSSPRLRRQGRLSNVDTGNTLFCNWIVFHCTISRHGWIRTFVHDNFSQGVRHVARVHADNEKKKKKKKKLGSWFVQFGCVMLFFPPPRPLSSDCRIRARIIQPVALPGTPLGWLIAVACRNRITPPTPSLVNSSSLCLCYIRNRGRCVDR